MFTLDQTLKAVSDSKGFSKAVFYNQSGYAVLWFDKSGYSVTDNYGSSHGTSGIMSYDKALEYFNNAIAQLMSLQGYNPNI